MLPINHRSFILIVQGHCGSCYAFASTTVLESAVAKQTGVVSPLLSTQFMMDCSSKLIPFENTTNETGWAGCYGSISYNVFELVMKFGKVMGSG